MLGDPACLAGYYVGAADIVQQGGLTVVDVAHDRDDGGAGDHIIRVVIVVVFFHFRGVVDTDELHRIAELTGHELDDVGFQSLIDGYHHPEAHTFTDDFGIAHVHQVSQFADADEFGYLQPVIEHFFASGLFRHFFAFGPTVFGFQAFAAAT